MQAREQEFQEYRTRSKLLKNLGDTISDLGSQKWNKAISYYLDAITTISKIDTLTAQDHCFIGDCYLNIGFNHSKLNSRPAEIEAYLQSISQYEMVSLERRDLEYYKTLLKYNYKNLIITYLENKQMDAAWACWKKIADIINAQNAKPDYDSLLLELAKLGTSTAEFCSNLKDYSEAEKWYLTVTSLAQKVHNPDTRSHVKFSEAWYSLAYEVYNNTEKTEKEISAYHSSISQLDAIPLAELRDRHRRNYSNTYYNLALTYDALPLPLQIQALRFAIDWRNKIKIENRTPVDKRELAIYHMELAKYLQYTPESVAACLQVLQDQPRTDFAEPQYFELLAQWNSEFKNHFRQESAECTTLVAAQKAVAELKQQTEQLAARVSGLEETQKKRKAVTVKPHPSSLFHTPSKPKDSEPEPKRRQSERLKLNQR